MEIVSERGLVYKVVGEGLDPKTVPLSSIMTEPIFSIEKIASISDANILILEYKINHLKITENKRIVWFILKKNNLPN